MKGLGIVLFLFCFASPLYASPWMRSSEEALISTGLSLSQDSKFWTPEGFLVQRESSNQFIYSFYYEQGYTRYYNLFAGGAYKYREGSMGVDKGITNLRVGVRGRLMRFRNGRTWEITALLPTRQVGLTGENPQNPGEGRFGMQAGLFYSHLPDPYEKPFAEFPFGVWSGGIGVLTLRSGNVPDEVQAYGNWSKQFLPTPFSVSMQLSALSSVLEPPGIVPYARFQSEGSVGYKLVSRDKISVSYAVDILGRNITQGNMLKVSFSHPWER